jgi:predicted nucleotidyltransferase
MRKADLEAIAKSLNDADVEFIVVGGIAVIEHGYGRNTFDLDIVIHLQEDAVIRVFAALARLGYRPRVPITAERFADPQERRCLIDEKQMQVLNFWSDLHRDTPLDIFVTEPFDFVKEYQTAKVCEVSPGVPVRIVTLETLLQMKKTAGRLKDLADVDELSLIHGLPSSYDRPE